MQTLACHVLTLNFISNACGYLCIHIEYYAGNTWLAFFCLSFILVEVLGFLLVFVFLCFLLKLQFCEAYLAR